MGSSSELKFVVFLLNELAEAWKMSTREVYFRLEKSGILENYIKPCYDVLHTQGAQYLVEDISDFARERGVLV